MTRIKYGLSVLILFLTCSYNVYGQVKRKHSSDSLKSYYQAFIGLPVYEFLLDDSIRHYTKFRFTMEPPGVLSAVRLSLDSVNTIEIYTCDLRYQNREKVDANWDKNLYYKETICSLTFFRNDELVLTIK